MKMSQMIMGFAGDFIQMGETLDRQQSNLNIACVAWNISILPKQKQETALDEYLIIFKKANPLAKKIDNLCYNMELLIEEKIRLYPKNKKKILEAKIIQIDGQNQIIVSSV